MIYHYLTKYEENGKKYAESWIQINLFGKCFCIFKRRIRIEPQWIPCNKRPPEKEDWYLVTTCRGVEIGKYLLPLEGTKPLIGHWIDDGFFGINPYAWMPLPKTYEVKE